MFTIEQATSLLKLNKKVLQNDTLQEVIAFNQSFPFSHRFTLLSPDDEDFTFLYDINQSAKNQFKLTLYLLNNDTKIGLLRVDYNGQHKNPETFTEKVPHFFHPYAGMFFNYHMNHIHYYVEGYKTTLDWALPLTEDNFPVKNISTSKDILDAFYRFNEIINLKTTFNINPLLI